VEQCSPQRRNAGAPGPDGITVDEFPDWLTPRWPAIRQQLLDGTYRPAAARRKAIPKPNGSERHLGIPNVLDRLIQQAILNVLTPIFDPHFSESSFGVSTETLGSQSHQADSTHDSRRLSPLRRHGPPTAA